MSVGGSGSDVRAVRRLRVGDVGVQSRFSAHFADDVGQRFDVVLSQRQRLDLRETLATFGRR